MAFSDTATVRENSLPVVKTPETWRPRVAGEVHTWHGENGETFKVLSVPDLDGSIMCLPQHRDDIIVGQGVPRDLQDRGVESFSEVSLDEETSLYFRQALTKLSVPLAVHATFNMETRPNLDDFPDNRYPIPILGIEGSPWSGKTAALLSVALSNDDSIIGVRDFDMFGIESINNCYSELKLIIDQDPSYLKSPLKIIKAIFDVYRRKRAAHEVPDTSGITLRQELSNLVEECRQPDNLHRYYILDLPGVGSRSAPPHIFQLLRFALPTINLTQTLTSDPSLNPRIAAGEKVRYQHKFSDDRSEDDVTAGYLLYLRGKIFNPGRKYDPSSLLNQALSEQYSRQLSTLRLTGKR
jgi:hypothetical protein